MNIEETRKGKENIVITEIPYMVNKTTFIETIAKCVQSGMIDGISDLRDESDREGMRIVVELQRDADPNLVLRQLYSRTQPRAHESSTWRSWTETKSCLKIWSVFLTTAGPLSAGGR